MSFDFGDTGPFPGQRRQDPLANPGFYTNNNASSSKQGNGNFLRRKKNNKNYGFADDDEGDGEGKDVAMPSDAAAKSLNFTELTHIRDRGRYGGFDALDTAPIIPMMETPLDIHGKKNSNIEYRKAKTSQKKAMMSNIAKMNNSYQHNHNLLNPIGSNGNENPANHSGSFNSHGYGNDPYGNQGPRSMSLATGAQKYPPNRQMHPQNFQRNQGPPNQGQPPRSMSFTNNPSNLNPMRQFPPQARQPGPPMSNDPRAMSLSGGRLPPFAPKPIPPNQRFGPQSRNNSLNNMTNPMMGNQMQQNMPPRNGSLTNMQNPYNAPRSQTMGSMNNPYNNFPRNGNGSNMNNMGNQQQKMAPRSGAMTNMQNLMGNAAPRNQSMSNNMQNPMGSGAPRNQSMSNNVQNPYNNAPRNGSMTKMQNPYNGMTGKPMQNKNSSRNGSLTNMVNPMQNKNSSRNGSLTNMANPYNNNNSPARKPVTSTSRYQSPMYQNANSKSNNNSSGSLVDAPSAPAISRSATATPPPPPNKDHSSPATKQNNTPKKLPRSDNNSPRKSPFKYINEASDDEEENQQKYHRSSLSEEVLKTNNARGNENGRGKLKEFLMDDNEEENPRTLSGGTNLASKNITSNPYAQNERSTTTREDQFVAENNPGTNSSVKPTSQGTNFDYSDNYIDEDDDDDMNYSAYDAVTKTKQSTSASSKPKSGLRRFNDSSEDEIEKVEVKPPSAKKPLRRKPPQNSPEPARPKSRQETIDTLEGSPSQSRRSFSGSNSLLFKKRSTKTAPEAKKNNFMAKLEASIDDSIGQVDGNSSTIQPNGTSGYDYSARMSRSNFKTILSPEIPTEATFDNSTIPSTNSNNKRISEVPRESINRNSFSQVPVSNKTSSVLSSDSDAKDSSSSNNRNSGIAGGFLKKLGLKKNRDKHRSKGDSKFNSRTSYQGGPSADATNKNPSNGSGNLFSSFNSNKVEETSYNHDVYNLKEEKAALFSKPEAKKQSSKPLSQDAWKSSPTNNDYDDLNAPSSFGVVADSKSSSIGKKESNSKFTLDDGSDLLNEKLFGDSLSGAFDDIENKIDQEILNSNQKMTSPKTEKFDVSASKLDNHNSSNFGGSTNPFSVNDSASFRDSELQAKAEVEGEFIRMGHNLRKICLDDTEDFNYQGVGQSKPKDLNNGASIESPKKMILSSNRLNLSVEQMGIMEANQSLINELQLMTKELTDSIQREVKLETDLRNRKLNLDNGNGVGGTTKVESLETEVREKSKTIANLMTELNDERKKRKIAEENVLLWESTNDVAPSFLNLSYEKSQLQSQLIDKQEQINQHKQLIYQFDAEKQQLREKYAEFEAENTKYKKKVVPDLTNEIELLRNNEYQISKKYLDQANYYQQELQSLKLTLANYESGATKVPGASANGLGEAEIEGQRDALREALKNLKESKEKEIKEITMQLRDAQDHNQNLESKVSKLSHLNEKLQEKLFG